MYNLQVDFPWHYRYTLLKLRNSLLHKCKDSYNKVYWLNFLDSLPMFKIQYSRGSVESIPKMNLAHGVLVYGFLSHLVEFCLTQSTDLQILVIILLKPFEKHVHHMESMGYIFLSHLVEFFMPQGTSKISCYNKTQTVYQ